jgi:predicted permease
VRTRVAFVSAWRSLTGAPGNSAAAVLALASAVGAFHTVGAVWDSAVNRALPYDSPEELVVLGAVGGEQMFSRFLSDREAALLQERAELFARVGHLWAAPMMLGDPPMRSVTVETLEPGLLEMFGVVPARGRPFRPEDHEGEARATAGRPAVLSLDRGQAVVLVSHSFWRTALGGTDDLEGTEIVLDREPMGVIGVLPEGFFTPTLAAEIWAPARRRQVATGPGGSSRSSHAYARLRPGVAPEAAAAEATALLAEAGFRREGECIEAVPLARSLTASVRPTLEILRAGALLLVLAAAMSVSGLRLARSIAGRRAAGIRRALGGSIRDEFLAALFRVTLLAAAVTAGSALLASLVVPLLRRYGADLPFAADWTAGLGVAGQAFLVAVLACAAAEAAPLLDTLRVRQHVAGMARFGGARRVRTVSPTLVLGVAAAAAILTATAVMGGSAWRLLAGRGGYSDTGLAQLTLDFGGRAGGASLPHSEKVVALNRLVERIEAIPEVESAGYADALPDEMGGSVMFTAAGSGSPRDPNSGRAIRSVSPGLLSVLGIPLVSGRGITDQDTPGSERVAVVDRSYARAAGHSNPVGQIVRMGPVEQRVVGLVPDLRVFPDRSTFPTAYVPFAIPPAFLGNPKVELVARFRDGPTPEQVAAIGRLSREVDASIRVTDAGSVRDRRIRLLGAPLLAGVALGIFAVAGLLLAVVGGIGHIADSVARESHANAVRTALGANPDVLLWGAFRSTAFAAVAGVAFGTLCGWMLSRAVAARVPWIEAGDPLSYLGPAALLLLLMLAASAFASLRTLRGDPWAVLRSL